MDQKYPRAYRALKNAGHSPMKAAEILLDASRGNERALLWIKIIRRWR